MKILISGASGFIGTAALQHLTAREHAIVQLTRRPGHNNASAVYWKPSANHIDPLPQDIDGVVHLAGENVFGRWTQAKKDRIYTSRVQGTTLLANRIASLQQKPKVFVCASAIGYYGDAGDTLLTESSPFGETFLSRVCRDWEAATEPARIAGIRVVNLRLGMVLDPRGGALVKMLTPFKLGLGGPLGSGRQWVSWITLEDVARLIDFALTTDTLCGPVNAVAPEPVTNRTLTRSLAAALHRPAVLPVPAALLKLALGDFARQALLASARVMPEKLLNAGFNFRYPALKSALTSALT